MSPALIAAAVILVLASAALVGIGALYRWDLTSAGYARWTRATGALALVSLLWVAAWTRIETPLVAAGIAVGGVVLAVLYVILHRQMTDRVRKLISDQD